MILSNTNWICIHLMSNANRRVFVLLDNSISPLSTCLSSLFIVHAPPSFCPTEGSQSLFGAHSSTVVLFEAIWFQPKQGRVLVHPSIKPKLNAALFWGSHPRDLIFFRVGVGGTPPFPDGFTTFLAATTRNWFVLVVEWYARN